MCVCVCFLAEEATDHLFNLSPFEMKTLLHMIISGKELGVTSFYSSRPSSTTIPEIIVEKEEPMVTSVNGHATDSLNPEDSSNDLVNQQTNEKKDFERKYLREELKVRSADHQLTSLALFSKLDNITI